MVDLDPLYRISDIMYFDELSKIKGYDYWFKNYLKKYPSEITERDRTHWNAYIFSELIFYKALKNGLGLVPSYKEKTDFIGNDNKRFDVTTNIGYKNLKEFSTQLNNTKFYFVTFAPTWDEFCNQYDIFSKDGYLYCIFIPIMEAKKVIKSNKENKIIASELIEKSLFLKIHTIITVRKEVKVDSSIIKKSNLTEIKAFSEAYEILLKKVTRFVKLNRD